MAVTPLKETIDVYNRNQQCSRTEQLRDPAIAADYAINKGDFINKDLLNVISESEGVIAKQGLTIGASGINVVINPGYGVFRNFIFSVPSLTDIDASSIPNGSTWSLILKVVEKRFTSGATSGGTETTDNALEGTPGTNPYGNLWPQVTSGYDANNCLQISINTVAFDVSNEWRYKYSFELLDNIPSNENPIAGKSINRFYVEIASVIKDASGNLTVIDKIFTNSVAYRNRSNYYINSSQMAPSKMTIIKKTQNVPPSGFISNFLLNPSGLSDTYILNFDDSASLNGYDPINGFILPGIDPINILPNGGNGHRFKLIIIGSDPTKKLIINQRTPRVDTAYPLDIQMPTINGFLTTNEIILNVGSITSFCIYNNTIYIEDGINHLTQYIYGDTNYGNTTFYIQSTTHKAALDALATALTPVIADGVNWISHCTVIAGCALIAVTVSYKVIGKMVFYSVDFSNTYNASGGVNLGNFFIDPPYGVIKSGQGKIGVGIAKDTSDYIATGLITANYDGMSRIIVNLQYHSGGTPVFTGRLEGSYAIN